MIFHRCFTTEWPHPCDTVGSPARKADFLLSDKQQATFLTSPGLCFCPVCTRSRKGTQFQGSLWIKTEMTQKTTPLLFLVTFNVVLWPSPYVNDHPKSSEHLKNTDRQTETTYLLVPCPEALNSHC